MPFQKLGYKRRAHFPYLPSIDTVGPHWAVVGALGAGETIFRPPQGMHVGVKKCVLLF